MKLKFVFIVMDILTLLAYPIVYLDGKLRQFSKPRGNSMLANSLSIASIIASK
jgi:hypothetical protein